MGQDPSLPAARPSPSEALRRALLAARRPQPASVAPSPPDPKPARTPPLRTINATGRVFAPAIPPLPLAEVAIEAVMRVCRGDPAPSPAALGATIAAATGADAALVLADLPDALTLVLASLAGPKGEVVVARGELRETDEGLRVEALIRASGARLREAGAVNAVTAEDVRAATSPATRVLLTLEPRAPGASDGHPPALAELARIARLQDSSLVHVSASGALRDDDHGPSVATLLREGADVVLAPADRLLGGPVAGIVAGSRDAMAPILRRAAAARPAPDRMTRAALAATLALHETGHGAAGQQLPVRRILAQDRLVLEERARRLAGLLADPPGLDPRIVASSAALGGGIGGGRIESRAVTLACPGRTAVDAVAALAGGPTAVACRLDFERLMFDVLMLRDDDLGTLAATVRSVLAPRPAA